MFNQIVIDSSAIIALLEQEKGAEIVEKNLGNAIISSVNLSEVITVINRKINDKKAKKEAIKLFRNSFPHIIEFNEEQAIMAGELDQLTSKFGLSLGDRACLALAKYKNLPVLTAEGDWKKPKIDVEIQLIR